MMRKGRFPRIGWFVGPVRFRSLAPPPVTIKAWLVVGVGRWGIVLARQERAGDAKANSTETPDGVGAIRPPP